MKRRRFISLIPVLGLSACSDIACAAPSFFDVRNYGAIGDGIKDDTESFLNCINDWIQSDRGGELKFPPGVYLIKKTLLFKFLSDSSLSRSIHGLGATLLFDMNSEDPAIVFDANGNYVRNIRIYGFAVKIKNKASAAIKFDGGELNSSWLYSLSCVDISIDAGDDGDGLVIVNNVFESYFQGVSVRNYKNNTGVMIKVAQENSGVPSSLQFLNCNTDGGRIGMLIKNPVSDVYCLGSTHIRSAEYGLLFENFVGGKIDSIHLENNWMSKKNPGAGMKIAGYGTLSGIYGTNNRDGGQRYVVELYVTKVMTVFAGDYHGEMDGYALVGGISGSVIVTDYDKGFVFKGPTKLKSLA